MKETLGRDVVKIVGLKSAFSRPSLPTKRHISRHISRCVKCRVPVRAGLFALIVGGMAGGCATTPEQVCSANWIKPRADAALADFKSVTSDAWVRLQRSGEVAAQRGELGLAEQARVLLDLGRVLGSFKDSRARSDLRRLAKTCNEPSLVSNALITTFEDYGVPQSYISLMRELDEFVELFSQEREVLR